MRRRERSASDRPNARRNCNASSGLDDRAARVPLSPAAPGKRPRRRRVAAGGTPGAASRALRCAVGGERSAAARRCRSDHRSPLRPPRPRAHSLSACCLQTGGEARSVGTTGACCAGLSLVAASRRDGATAAIERCRGAACGSRVRAVCVRVWRGRGLAVVLRRHVGQVTAARWVARRSETRGGRPRTRGRRCQGGARGSRLLPAPQNTRSSSLLAVSRLAEVRPLLPPLPPSGIRPVSTSAAAAACAARRGGAISRSVSDAEPR